MTVILAHKRELGSCITEGRIREPSTSGKLLVSFKVTARGDVEDVAMVNSEVAGSYAANCVMTQVLPRMRFVEAPGPDVITFPFKF